MEGARETVGARGGLPCAGSPQKVETGWLVLVGLRAVAGWGLPLFFRLAAAATQCDQT